MNFAAGYGMAMISYVQMFYVCEFGESVEVIKFKINYFIFKKQLSHLG